jgi:hypothetical protein
VAKMAKKVLMRLAGRWRRKFEKRLQKIVKKVAEKRI